MFLRIGFGPDDLRMPNEDLKFHPAMTSSAAVVALATCTIAAIKFTRPELRVLGLSLVIAASVGSFVCTRADLTVVGLPDNEGQSFYAGRALQLVVLPVGMGLGFYAALRLVNRSRRMHEADLRRDVGR